MTLNNILRSFAVSTATGLLTASCLFVSPAMESDLEMARAKARSWANEPCAQMIEERPMSYSEALSRFDIQRGLTRYGLSELLLVVTFRCDSGFKGEFSNDSLFLVPKNEGDPVDRGIVIVAYRTQEVLYSIQYSQNGHLPPESEYFPLVTYLKDRPVVGKEYLISGLAREGKLATLEVIALDRTGPDSGKVLDAIQVSTNSVTDGIFGFGGIAQQQYSEATRTIVFGYPVDPAVPAGMFRVRLDTGAESIP